MNTSIMQLVKSGPVLTPTDTVRRAAGLIRGSEGSRVLVVDEGRVAGAVSEQAVAGLLWDVEDTEKALSEPIESLVEEYPVFVNVSATLKEAAQLFASNGADVLPVVDSFGALRGVLYRRDVIGVLTRTMKPPTVAGMATPLGVYLTTGSHRGGVGNLGLFLTGMSLVVMITIAMLIVEGLQTAFSHLTGIPVSLFLASPPLTIAPNIYDLAFYISTALTIIIMLLLLRLSPLSGYHAAEHMTVHAIEAGEDLSPETVRRMPRVHPRCGTNLLAAASVFIILTTKISNQFSVLVALMVVVVGWRAIGGWLQYVVTTKSPNDRQLANGVAAGKQLLERFHERPDYQTTGLDRIWNMGFLQTFSGMMLFYALLSIVQSVFNISIIPIL